MSSGEQRAPGRGFPGVVPRLPLVLASILVLVAACSRSPRGEGAATGTEEAAGAPFVVRDGAEGLLFVYGDAEGFHPVERLADVPAGARARVRVDSLTLPPERRLDPAMVYVADLRSPGPDGTYRVRTMPRADFEASFGGAAGAPRDKAAEWAGAGDAPAEAAAAATGDVIVYGASWCGACRSAEAFFRSRGVPFVEKDIEREPGAREEMLAKARAAGIDGSSIPVIDFRGTVLTGFDPGRLDALIGGGRPPSTL